MTNNTPKEQEAKTEPTPKEQEAKTEQWFKERKDISVSELNNQFFDTFIG